MTRDTVALVDCGTSRIKGALLESKGDRPGQFAEAPAPAPTWGSRGECELDPGAIATAVRGVIETLCQLGARPPAAIYLCTEMHGFVVADEELRPRTPYIGWRDTRAAVPDEGGRRRLAELEQRIGARFRVVTGMRLRAGLPAANLACLEAAGSLPDRFTLLTLADWIAASLGQWNRCSHVTMAASTGLLDISARRWSDELLEAVGIPRRRVFLAGITDGEKLPIGSARMQHGATPLFAGAGDLQCAVLGAGVPEAADICVNVGTGSQVVGMARAIQPEGVELRPYFKGRTLFARSHIPAGRMLDYFAAFFSDVAGAESGSARFWTLLQSLDADEIGDAPFEVDPNVFPGSWRFRAGGGIIGLREGGLSARKMVASIAKGWVRQYADAISEVGADKRERRVALAGGLPRRLPWFSAALAAASGRTILPIAPGEDTLNGLACLARRPS